MYLQGTPSMVGTVKVVLEPNEKLVVKLIDPGDGFTCPIGKGQMTRTNTIEGPCTNKPDPVPTQCGFQKSETHCFNMDDGYIDLYKFKINDKEMPIASLKS